MKVQVCYHTHASTCFGMRMIKDTLKQALIEMLKYMLNDAEVHDYLQLPLIALSQYIL